MRETFRSPPHAEPAGLGRPGPRALSHRRVGDKNSETQPFFVNSPYGIALAHNGNLTNARELAGEMRQRDRRYLNTDSDSELLLNVFAHELLRTSRRSMDADAVFRAVRGVHKRCKGAYSAVCLILGFGLVAFRDPYGIRPMVVGRREGRKGPEYLVASESVALQQLGFELAPGRDAGRGLGLSLRRGGGEPASAPPARNTRPCIFEYVYFARPDSLMDRISVHKARLRMGERLVEKIRREHDTSDVDVVIPIPDTSRTSAMEVANRLNVKYREGFIKNRYIGRTFIMPGQDERKRSVRQKLNPINLEFRGKNVLLVDDSIVRGTTSRQIVEMSREAGARKVYFASAAPPVRYQNVYGIDMPAPDELIASNRTRGRGTGADRRRLAGLSGSGRSDFRGEFPACGDHRIRRVVLQRPVRNGWRGPQAAAPGGAGARRPGAGEAAGAQAATEEGCAGGRRPPGSVCPAAEDGRIARPGSRTRIDPGIFCRVLRGANVRGTLLNAAGALSPLPGPFRETRKSIHGGLVPPSLAHTLPERARQGRQRIA